MTEPSSNRHDYATLGLEIGNAILAGFHDYFEEFLAITLGARQRFMNADWIACQQRSKDRINLYLEKILILKAEVRDIGALAIHDPELWLEAKQAYSELIEGLPQHEIAETFFNSVYCKFFDHNNISDRYMFVLAHPQQSPAAEDYDSSIFKYYYFNGDLRGMLDNILSDCDLGLPYENLPRDIDNMLKVIFRELPPALIRDPGTYTLVHGCVFYRSKAAYLIGKVVGDDTTMPFVIPILQNQQGTLYVDTLIFDSDDLSVLFSYTRAYFKVDAPVPSEIVRFLRELMPWKPNSELYNSIGFNRHGKTEFYREYLEHMANSDDKFVIAPGIKGMVMSVFTLPSYEKVFKIIKDKFTPPKEMTKQVVKEKYALVSRHDRAGRMADTQEYSNFLFPRERFSQELVDELLEVAPSIVEVGEKHILIRHLYVERRMIPLNLYFENATEKEVASAIDEYGWAIKELAAADIFPGDMLYKNFGVTRHKRVVFYDYDEICPLTDVNFRSIPPPRTPEDEMASEPWYSVGPNDVFPEEFPTFLLGNPKIRKIFQENHRELFDPNWWKGLQQALCEGQVMDVLPYHKSKVFKRD